jgi:tRNA-dihydrouridine synthase B
MVTGGVASGSALMREPDLAEALVAAVSAVSAVDVPVTVKMRLGWDDDSRNAADIARRAVDAGAQAITVHGRTRCQFYKGEADWEAVAAVKQAVACRCWSTATSSTATPPAWRWTNRAPTG